MTTSSCFTGSVADQDEDRSQRLTRLISYVLRHGGPQLGLASNDGWFQLDDLVGALRLRRLWADLSRSEVLDLIQQPGSTRFEVAGERLRACYGHSLPDISAGTLGNPPSLLFHATRKMFLPAIQNQGLIANGRSYVHLASSLNYALSLKAGYDAENFVGVILGIQAHLATSAGLRFFQASSVVWTVSNVPSEFLTILVLDESRVDTFQQVPLLDHSAHDPLESLFTDSEQ